jgi:putative cardiolipin synthase
MHKTQSVETSPSRFERGTARPQAAGHMLAVLLACSATFGCRSIPRNPIRVETTAMAPTPAGMLKKTSQQVLKGYAKGDSAFLLLPENRAALEWRLALIDHATSSLDMKYFIWEGDASGHLMMSHLIAAANRGVRVRLMLDDMTMAAADQDMSLLDSIPNMALRLYNPARTRGVGGWLNYLGEKPLNQRMHNKLMVVDGHWAIAGGRNIGNSYYGLSEKYNFRDLDALITGAIVPELAHAYDEYWNCSQAYPVDQIKKAPTGKKRAKRVDKLGAKLEKHARMLGYSPFPLTPRDWSDRFETLPKEMVAGRAEYFHDAPDTTGEGRLRMLDVLETNMPPPEVSAVFVSPYFLPSSKMLAGMKQMEAAGAEISLVTASLAANNHTAVHAHYKKYRRRILATGTDIYEFDAQPVADVRAMADTTPVTSAFISLHVKAAVVDGKRVTIGSLNLDPRAMDLNTENVLVIHSEPLAAQLTALIEELCEPGNAWQVKQNKKGKLRWHSGDKVRKSVPARGFGQRIGDFFYRWLPIEKQL